MNLSEASFSASTRSQATPEGLLSSVEDQTAGLYTKIAEVINSGRPDDSKIVVVTVNQLVDTAEQWLAGDQKEIMSSINEGLYHTPDDPVVLLPVPHADLTHEEIVCAWDHAASTITSENSLLRDERFWHDLKKWNAHALSYFDASRQESPVRFVAIETGYDQTRVGPRLRDESNFDPNKVTFQLEEIWRLRKQYPYVRPVDLFAGAVLASRFAHITADKLPEDVNKKTYTWDVLLQPDDGGCIADDGWLPTASINASGQAEVSFITGMYGNYSKRMVMKK